MTDFYHKNPVDELSVFMRFGVAVKFICDLILISFGLSIGVPRKSCSPSSVHFHHEHHVVPRDLSRGQMVKEHFPKPRPADQCSNHYRPTSQADQTALDVIVYQDYNLHWCFHGFFREIKIINLIVDN